MYMHFNYVCYHAALCGLNLILRVPETVGLPGVTCARHAHRQLGGASCCRMAPSSTRTRSLSKLAPDSTLTTHVPQVPSPPQLPVWYGESNLAIRSS